jgi:hypothetical protein
VSWPAATEGVRVCVIAGCRKVGETQRGRSFMYPTRAARSRRCAVPRASHRAACAAAARARARLLAPVPALCSSTPSPTARPWAFGGRGSGGSWPRRSAAARRRHQQALPAVERGGALCRPRGKSGRASAMPLGAVQGARAAPTTLSVRGRASFSLPRRARTRLAKAAALTGLLRRLAGSRLPMLCRP